jgi:hypothetical protein
MDVSIDKLLASRNSRRLENPGDDIAAKARAPVSKLLARHFSAFNKLRAHLVSPSQHPVIASKGAVQTICDCLKDLGWISQIGKKRDRWGLSVKDVGVNQYLRGAWLEEYVYLAHIEAGCDEIYFSQKVEWTVEGITGSNEIDVMARRGGVLSFTSCKCIQPFGHGLDKLRAFLSEADYWDRHFASGSGRVLLMTTADFYDEINGNSHRYPLLLARARILEVDMAGLEDLEAGKLPGIIESHWSG